MKLTELDASFIGRYDAATGSFYRQEDIDGAQGVLFRCPLCHNETVVCWFSNPINATKVSDEAFPKPGRWEASGNSLADLTLNPSVSLDLGRNVCRWHGWVKNGEAA